MSWAIQPLLLCLARLLTFELCVDEGDVLYYKDLIFCMM